MIFFQKLNSFLSIRTTSAVLTALFLFSLSKMYGEDEWYSKVQRQCLSGVAWEEEEWPNERFGDYIQRILDYQKKLHPVKKIRASFSICQPAVQNQPASPIINDPATWKDLRLFCGKDEDDTASLINVINRTQTQAGKAMLALMLVQPTTDIKELKRRQEILKQLVGNPELLEKLSAALAAIAEHENYLFSFYLNDQLQKAVKGSYFNFPERVGRLNTVLNNSIAALTAISVMAHSRRVFFGASTLVAAAVLPLYGVLNTVSIHVPDTLDRFTQRNLMGAAGAGFTMLADFIGNPKMSGLITSTAGVYCGIAAKNDVEWAQDCVFAESSLQNKLVSVTQYVKAVNRIKKIMIRVPEIAQGLSHSPAITDFFEREDIQELLNELKAKTFKSPQSWNYCAGRVLKTYALMHEKKDLWKELIAAIGELDAYVSMARLISEHADKRVGYCFAEFSSSSRPEFFLEECWNPFVNPDIVVTNSVHLGGTSHRGIILTGPNEGGKSTTLRAIGTNGLLAQTFGIGAARSILLTPFSIITTYFNISDNLGEGISTFKAEAMRAHFLTKQVESLPENKFSLILADELFKGSSPVESEAAAFSIAQYIASFDNNISMFATHFPLLTTLGEGSELSNFQIAIENMPDGTIKHLHTIIPGIYTEKVAINVLRQEGFCQSILDQAQLLITEHN